ncbi:PfkB family carbohydrate kinase [Varunaivibrio sulfuroxidans]|uniref:PfkB family carbohydrate kinase n=1 Tax=Varunaivibrio sulfuroxidans TaxID=1773489 RepID=UPI0010473B9F|nr:PfkB family carbohydrate kinase [Varunaivibrio sulfuroxidans]WES31846.1 PfkB family carbohydrate kinase [Varunaivibrio sulfuroxidans]
MPPFQVRSVDSAAAGDCFNAGLAYGLAERWRLKKSVRFAAACGLGIRNIHSLRLAKVGFGVGQTKNSDFASKIGRHSSILR